MKYVNVERRNIMRSLVEQYKFRDPVYLLSTALQRKPHKESRLISVLKRR